MKLTTRKTVTARYAVLADGKPIGIYIDKSTPAKYRVPQEWDVSLENGEYLFSCKGKSLCLTTLQQIVDFTSNRRDQ